jgi:steroid delta-isomerase-like uncharacterized protein
MPDCGSQSSCRPEFNHHQQSDTIIMAATHMCRKMGTTEGRVRRIVMSVEENKDLSRRWLEGIWGKGNLATVDELAGAGFVWHWAPVGVAGDREGYKQFVRMNFAAVSDVSSVTEDIVAEGDKVASRWTWRATHKGEFMGVPPTGKQMTLTGMCINRIVDGKIVEEWGEMDMLGVMQQLGAAPPPS